MTIFSSPQLRQKSQAALFKTSIKMSCHFRTIVDPGSKNTDAYETKKKNEKY